MLVTVRVLRVKQWEEIQITFFKFFNSLKCNLRYSQKKIYFSENKRVFVIFVYKKT